ncbi:hypothetical protein [Nonomuraea dietziae]|uniref:hypothetical protein n=1 Tax=Nonomuraea dietziae TaxID=65515 RepID=UPI0031E44104
MDLPDELELPESRWNRTPPPEEPELPDPSWNRFQEPRRESPWPRRIATTLSVLLVVQLVQTLPASAASRPAPSVQKEKPVKGQAVPVLAPMADPVQKQVWKAPPRVAWPKPQKAELGGGAATLAAGFPVKLAPARGEARAAAAAEPVSVELLDTELLGLAMRVSPGQGVAAAGAAKKTRLQIDYSGFRHAYGGDYGARLRMVKVDECALDAAAANCAAPEPVKSENDAKAGTLTAEVETGAVYALTAAASGQSGDHSATSLSPSADWSVGTQTGDFTWGYDMRTPPRAGWRRAGDLPGLLLAERGRPHRLHQQPGVVGR